MLIYDEHPTTNRDQQNQVFYSNSQETEQRNERELESSESDSEHQNKISSRQTDREEYKRNQLVKSSMKISDALNKPSSQTFW